MGQSHMDSSHAKRHVDAKILTKLASRPNVKLNFLTIKSIKYCFPLIMVCQYGNIITQGIPTLFVSVKFLSSC